MYRARHVSQRATRRQRRSKQALVAAGALAVALIASPATASAQTSTGPVGSRAVDVNVHSGDTISAIVARGCGHSSPALWRGVQLDNPAVTDVNRIYPGQTLRITCRSAPATSSPDSTGSAAWVSPVLGGQCSSRYGPRQGGFHRGSDVAVPPGTPIRAIAAGTVVANHGNTGAGGFYVVLKHPAGPYTAYMHMIRRSPLAVGAHVAAGQTIGNVGATGDASGPHLHLEIQTALWSKYLDPAPFLRAHGVRFQC